MDGIRRGELAQQALDNEALKEALKAMREDITGQWGSVPVRDVEGREHCWRLFKSLEKFEALLKAYIESGKADLQMLKHKRTPLEAVKSAIGM